MTPLSPAFESLKLATACLERKTVLYVPGVFGSGPSTPDVVEAMGHLERAIACVALAVEEGRSPEDPTAARVKVLEEENARLRRELEACTAISQSNTIQTDRLLDAIAAAAKPRHRDQG